MSLTEQYEALKKNGTIIDRLKYLRTVADPSSFLRDDPLVSIILASMQKNQKILHDLFNQNDLPVQLRIKAAEGWLRNETDEDAVHQFIVHTLQERSMPRRLKHQILKLLHVTRCGNKFSASFYYNLALALTRSMDRDQFNIDAHTLPYCSSETQIRDLLSRWSIARFSQIDPSSALRARLLRYQRLIVIELIKADLASKNNVTDQLQTYFRDNRALFGVLAKSEPQAMCRLAIDHLNHLDKHRRVLPAFISSDQKRFFRKAPNEMIELLLLAAQHQPGTIKYEANWGNDGWDLTSLTIPSSFSVDHYVQLFLGLYERCNWSSNHLTSILSLLLPIDGKGLYAVHKRSRWFNEIVIQQKIGKELFMKKLLKQGTDNTLAVLCDFPDLRAPLGRQLLAQLDRTTTVTASQRIDYLRCEPLTNEMFEKLLALFKEVGSDVHQRTKNYPQLLQSAVATSSESVAQALQWIAKRLTNEQLLVVERLVQTLNDYDDRFHLKLLPKNLEPIEQIFNIAFGHLQCSTNTVQLILDYAVLLLKRAEFCRKADDQTKLRVFACKTIQRCLSVNQELSFWSCQLNRSMPTASNLLANILIADLFPKLIAKANVTTFQEILSRAFADRSHPDQIDAYLSTFFFDHLPKSNKLQAEFKLDQNEQLIKLLLEKRPSRLSRALRLIQELSDVFLMNDQVQQTLVRSEQGRPIIDRLVQQNKSISYDDLMNHEGAVKTSLANARDDVKMPGLSTNTLSACPYQLTGDQQVHITQIILDDYLVDKEVRNIYKLKALRVLRRLSPTHHITLEWVHKRQAASAEPVTTKTTRAHCVRGADAQSIDDLLICLPATLDLTPEALMREFHSLKEKLNASNAKFISQAMLAVSRKVPDEVFLKAYLDLVGSDQFPKLGITTNKEVLRLLVNYRKESALIDTVIQPLWSARPHQDVRACLVTTLLQFFEKAGKDPSSPIWSILEEAAADDYLPVVQALFAPTRIAHTDSELFRKFVERIQFRVLDHAQKLEARVYAWSNIDHEHCDTKVILEKAKGLCSQFDKDANACWQAAFSKAIACCKHTKSSSGILVDLVQSIMARRDEIDPNQNAVDAQHDLPVYHRVHHILKLLASQIDELRKDHGEMLRNIVALTLKFDLTLVQFTGRILIGLAANKEEMWTVLANLQTILPSSYAERMIDQLGSELQSNKALSPFVSQLSSEEKLAFVQWFVQEKHQELFVFDLFTGEVLNDTSVDREQCQQLLRQIRQSENLSVRQKALEYTVAWNDDDMSVSDNSDMET